MRGVPSPPLRPAYTVTPSLHTYRVDQKKPEEVLDSHCLVCVPRVRGAARWKGNQKLSFAWRISKIVPLGLKKKKRPSSWRLRQLNIKFCSVGLARCFFRRCNLTCEEVPGRNDYATSGLQLQKTLLPTAICNLPLQVGPALVRLAQPQQP